MSLRMRKDNSLCFRPGPTQTGLYSHRSRLEARNFGFKKKGDCTICVAKSKPRSRSAPLFSHIQIFGFLVRRFKSFTYIFGICFL